MTVAAKGERCRDIPYAMLYEGIARPDTAAIALFASPIGALGLRGILTGMAILAWQPLAGNPVANMLVRADGCLLLLLGVAIMAHTSRPWGKYGLAFDLEAKQFDGRWLVRLQRLL